MQTFAKRWLDTSSSQEIVTHLIELNGSKPSSDSNNAIYESIIQSNNENRCLI